MAMRGVRRTYPHFFWPALLCLGSMAAVLLAWGTTNVISERRTYESLMIGHNETLEVLAIKDLHSKLDDNKDGQVDYEESTEFVRERFPGQSHYRSGDDRSHTLHLEDDRISLDELWGRWKESKVYNWTTDDVIEWLEGVVDLPELAPQFRQLGINGRQLPLIATNGDQFLSQLEVTRHQRKKLQLRAMDIVLFGPLPSPHSYWKDVVMSLSVLLCVMGLTTAWRKHHSANRKIDAFLKEIRVYETELRNLKKKSRIQGTSSDSTDGETRNRDEEERRGEEETEKTNSLSDVSVSSSSSSSSSSSAFDLTVTASSSAPSPPEKPKSDDVTTEERPVATAAPPQSQTLEFQHSLSSASDAETRNESLRMKIWNLENQIELLTQNRIALKQLLLETCLQEKSFLDHNKRTAEDEVIRAQKLCDKIKRKRSSVIGAFRLANSSTLEDAGLMITRAVNKMQKVTEHFDGFQKRWKTIEKLTGFSLLSSAHSSTQSMTSLAGDSPRSRGSISHHLHHHQRLSRNNRSRASSLKDEQLEGVLFGKTGDGEAGERGLYPRSLSLNESEQASQREPLPSWFSAPNSLYYNGSPCSSRSSYSEVLEIMQQESNTGGGSAGAVSESMSPVGLMFEVEETEKDSLGIIEEEEGSGVFRHEGTFLQNGPRPLQGRPEIRSESQV